jgi:hypothetical protein
VSPTLGPGGDQPGVGRGTFRLVGDLTALGDEAPEVLGERRIGRVSPVVEVLDRHHGLGRAGVHVPGRSARPGRKVPRPSAYVT